MKLESLARQPLKLQPNRVRRPFRGGLLLDRWQGLANPQDGFQAEEWVASTIEARNPQPVPGEGLSRVVLGDGATFTLKEALAADPESFLGGAHFGKHGSNTAVLVKVLDSYSRLMIQVHPDRQFALKELNSDFGKTEAWYILGGRMIDGEEPYVLLGFKPGITQEIWRDLFERQDVAGMVDALHRFPVKPGDIFLVEGGVPHAAGPGCFFMEIQEPTDYTMRVERIGPSGAMLTDDQMHQGTDFIKMLDCFHYHGLTAGETLSRWRLIPRLVREEAAGRVTRLLSYQDTPFFAMNLMEIGERLEIEATGRFSVAVVLKGTGKLCWDGGEIRVGQADELFLPAALGQMIWVAESGNILEVVECLPPL